MGIGVVFGGGFGGGGVVWVVGGWVRINVLCFCVLAKRYRCYAPELLLSLPTDPNQKRCTGGFE